MSSIQTNYGLTANGNEYQKSNTGKIAGAAVGFALPTLAGTIRLSQLQDSINLENTKISFKNCSKLKPATKTFEQATKTLFTTQNVKTLGIVGCALTASTIVGVALGNLYDKCINKERMAQADGEAKLNQNA